MQYYEDNNLNFYFLFLIQCCVIKKKNNLNKYGKYKRVMMIIL